MNTPQFSFVLPIYNGAIYLREALASLRWQTLRNWECLCINDGSTDGTDIILEEFAAADDRFRILHQANAGIVAALNRGIREARAPWIARMDADDVALPDRLATQAEYVAHHPDTLLVSTHVLCIDAEGRPIAVQAGPTEHAAIERCLLAGKNTINHPTVVMRRDELLAAGMYRQEFEWVEDADLWLRLMRRGKVASIPKILLHYRMHDQSVCSTRQDLQRRMLRRLLTTAHADRGITPPSRPTCKKFWPRPQASPASHRLARRAARSGYYRTAFSYWWRQVNQSPFSRAAARGTVELAMRALTAVLQGKWPPFIVLPNWRAWDADAVQPLAEEKKTTPDSESHTS